MSEKIPWHHQGVRLFQKLVEGPSKKKKKEKKCCKGGCKCNWIGLHKKTLEFIEAVETAHKDAKKSKLVFKGKTKMKSEEIPTGEMIWTRNVRESGLLEHMCEHGVGHPDYTSAMRIAEHYKHPVNVWLAHGCDGCCGRADFPGKVKQPNRRKRSL